MKLLLVLITIMTLPLLARAEESEFSVANEVSEADRVDEVTSGAEVVAEAEYRNRYELRNEPMPTRKALVPGTYGYQRCSNINARIQQILKTYREDSDESLRSLPYEGPNASLGRELRELRSEQTKWDCL